jgi:hypothetical protein
MRPCNQCRRPVENAQLLCDQCAASNRERGVQCKPSVSMNAFDSSKKSRIRWDQRVNPMLAGFAISTLTFLGLLGYVFGGASGALIGALLSLFLIIPFSLTMKG